VRQLCISQKLHSRTDEVSITQKAQERDARFTKVTSSEENQLGVVS